MILAGVMDTRFDVITAWAAMSIAVLLQQTSGDTKSRWSLLHGRFGGNGHWHIGCGVLLVEHVALVLIEMDIWIGEGINDGVVWPVAGYVGVSQ